MVRYVSWSDLYATAETNACCGDWEARGSRPRYVDVPDGVVTTPIVGSHQFGVVPVAKPAEAVDGELPRIATTKEQPTNGSARAVLPEAKSSTGRTGAGKQRHRLRRVRRNR